MVYRVYRNRRPVYSVYRKCAFVDRSTDDFIDSSRCPQKAKGIKPLNAQMGLMSNGSKGGETVLNRAKWHASMAKWGQTGPNGA